MKRMRSSALAGFVSLVLVACAHEHPPAPTATDSGPDVPTDGTVPPTAPPLVPVEDGIGTQDEEQARLAAERAALEEARRQQALEAARAEEARLLAEQQRQRLAEEERRRRAEEEQAALDAAAIEPGAGMPAEAMPEDMSASDDGAAGDDSAAGDNAAAAAPNYARRATASPMQPGQTGVVALAVSYELDSDGLQQWLQRRYPDLSTHATRPDRTGGATGTIPDAPLGKYRYLSARLRCLQLDCPTEDEAVYREVIAGVPMLWQWSFAVPADDSFRQGQIEIDLFGAQTSGGELQPLNPIPKVDIRFEIHVEPPSLFERIMQFLGDTEKLLGVIAAIIGIVVGIILSLRKLRGKPAP